MLLIARLSISSVAHEDGVPFDTNREDRVAGDDAGPTAAHVISAVLRPCEPDYMTIFSPPVSSDAPGQHRSCSDPPTEMSNRPAGGAELGSGNRAFAQYKIPRYSGDSQQAHRCRVMRV